MASRLIAPRRSWETLQEAAQDLGCVYSALYRYAESRGGRWHLKALDEEVYARWHERVWAPAQRRKEKRTQ
jgi:hypothetical protein